MGVYDKNECAIELSGVGHADAGEWSCEMENYIWGPARGATHKKTLKLSVVDEEEEEATTQAQESSEEGGERERDVTDLSPSRPLELLLLRISAVSFSRTSNAKHIQNVLPLPYEIKIVIPCGRREETKFSSCIPYFAL